MAAPPDEGERQDLIAPVELLPAIDPLKCSKGAP
jgi:hypothetical protein